VAMRLKSGKAGDLFGPGNRIRPLLPFVFQRPARALL
jgi:hypothetical protein